MAFVYFLPVCFHNVTGRLPVRERVGPDLSTVLHVEREVGLVLRPFTS